MSFDYDSLQLLSTDLINDFGQDITLTTVTAGTFNPATGATTGDSETTATVKAVVTDYRDFQIDGGAIQRGDKQVILSGSVAAPDTNDMFTINSLEYMIVNINTISPGGTDVLYKIQVRR